MANNKVRFSGYNIWCPKHGYKSAVWMDDTPSGTRRMSVKEQFERQFQTVTGPSHADCGSFTIVKDLRGGTREDLDKFKAQVESIVKNG